MELGTKFLFNLLLRFIKPSVICDIGSMDGSDALRFKKILPTSQIVIFEANPDNYAQIVGNPFFSNEDISIFNEVVWNENGPKEFFIQEASDQEGKDEHLRGMSSAFPRTLEKEPAKIQLNGVRVDSKMAEMKVNGSIALWIDVEGASYEVLQSITNVREQVKLIHAEVENEAFWEGQKTREDVIALADKMGYVMLGHGRNKEQHDIVLIDKDLLARFPRVVKIMTWIAFFRTIRLKDFPTSFKKDGELG
ncbi:MAG: FkbM family methyltransferase [Desulfobacter sp.]|nr:MAG: FkbM family methyltransferase [Desulfobacter sp.]